MPKKNYQGMRSIGLNASYLFFVQLVGSFLRILYTIAITRFLGPELYGYFNYGLGWYLVFLALANFYLEAYLSRQLSVNYNKAQEIISQTFTLRLSTVFLSLVISLSFISFLESEQHLFTLLCVFSVAMVGRSLAMWCNSIFVAMENAKYLLFFEFAFRSVEVLVGFFLLWNDYSIISLATLHAITWWMQALVSFFLVKKKVGHFYFTFKSAQQLSILKWLLPFTVANIALSWMMQGPLVLFRYMSNSADLLGQLSLILQIVFLIGALPASIGRAALPVLSRSVGRKDNKDAMYLEVIVRMCFFTTLFIALCTLSIGKEILPLVFGERYLLAGELISYGIWLLLPFSIGVTANQLLIVHDRKKWSMVAAGSGALLMTLSLYFFSPSENLIVLIGLVFLSMSAWALLSLKGLSHMIMADWSLIFTRPLLSVLLTLIFYYSIATIGGVYLSFATSILFLIALVFLLNLFNDSEYKLLKKQFLKIKNR